MAGSLLVLALSVSGGLGCRAGAKGTSVPPEQARSLLIDRNWIDRLPTTPRDRLHVFRFVPNMGGGVYQDRTLFAGQFELFGFETDGRTLLFKLYHTDDTVRVPLHITRLPESEGSPFDMLLHIDDSPRGPSDYYSLRDDPHGGDLDQSLRALWPNPAR